MLLEVFVFFNFIPPHLIWFNFCIQFSPYSFDWYFCILKNFAFKIFFLILVLIFFHAPFQFQFLFIFLFCLLES
jgi:hypothetical protein